MESLSYAFDGRPLLFTDDTDFPINGAVTNNKHMLKKWDGEDAVGNMGFIDHLLPNVVKKPALSNQCLGNSSHHLGKSAESSIMEFGNGNPSFIDSSVLPPLVSAKRSRITNIQSPVPTCQVYGCNKDLSSAKDYHKRHKVCAVHSKTPVVIVNGIEQRFCQQCSRFQKVGEFDEGKRSCRKRLAGHNQRRRKPLFDSHLGSTYISTGESKTSLIFSRILPSGFFGLQYNETTNHHNLEEDVKFGQSLPQSVLDFHKYHSKKASVHEISGSSDSSSALSLLSQSHNVVSRNSEEISTAHPFTFEDSLGEICTSENFSPFIPNSSAEQESNSVSLVELSLHLQRVEHQKYYGQVKLENGLEEVTQM